MIEEQKRYYWLKLKLEHHNSDVVDFVVMQKNGFAYWFLYEKLCFLAINTAGKLIREIAGNIIIFTVERIYLEFAKYFDFDTIIVALELLKKVQLIAQDDNGIFYICNFEKMVGSESSSAERVRKHRERKALQCNTSNSYTITQESISQSLESRADQKRLKKKLTDNNRKNTMPSNYIGLDNIPEDDFFNQGNLELDRMSHLFTRYLIHAKYLNSDDKDIQKFNRLFLEIDDELKSPNAYLTFKNYQVIIQRFIAKWKGRTEPERVEAFDDGSTFTFSEKIGEEVTYKFAYFNKSFTKSIEEYMVYLYKNVWDGLKRRYFEKDYPEIIK